MALLEGGALRDGLGCGGERGTGSTPGMVPTWVRAAATEAWEAAAASVEPTVGLPWAVGGATAAVGGGTTATLVAVVGEGATAATAELWLDPPTGGGEERHTRGLKLCPPHVFTMAGLEKERRWIGWEEDDRIRMNLK